MLKKQSIEMNKMENVGCDLDGDGKSPFIFVEWLI